jgi:diguanylate cyclase
MNRWLLRSYFTVQAIALAAYVLVPRDTWAQSLWQVGVGWIAAAAILISVRIRRPYGVLAWYFLAAGLFCNATGTLAEGIEARVFGITANPSWADPLWLAFYPCVMAGMFVLIRLRTTSRDWSTLVDTTTITTGLGLLSWVFIIHPSTVSANLNLLGRIVVVSYPVLDVVFLAMLVRLLLGGGNRTATSRLISSSVIAFLAADAAWAVFGHNSKQPPPDSLQCVFELNAMASASVI